MDPVDLIIRDADVRTMNPRAPRAEAIAVTGTRITAVGSTDEIAALAGPDTEQLSAHGHTVLPGIIDAHNHVRLGATTPAVSLAGAANLDQIRARITAHLAQHPGLEWIEGDGWNYTAIPSAAPRLGT